MRKGLFKNTNPDYIPEEYAFHAKNAITNWKLDSYINEKGTFELDSLGPYSPLFVNGVIVHGANIIYFFKNTSGQDCILVHNEDTPSTTLKVQRTDFDFNVNYPISGVAKYNSDRELVVTFTDFRSKPRYINLDKAVSIDFLETYNLFLGGKFADQITSSIEENGSILSGTYFISYRYLTRDESYTNFSPLIGPFHINTADTGATETGKQTNKSIKIELANINTNFAKIEISVISSIKGVLKAESVKYQNIYSENLTIIYRGSETVTTLLIPEVIQQPINFEKVKHIAAVDNKLYLAGLETKDFAIIDATIQQQIVNITPYWTSVSGAIKAENRTGEAKTFIHDEIYALYIQGQFTDGTLTKNFHLPGRAPSGLEASPRTINGATVKAYQIEDTCTSIGTFTETFNGVSRTFKYGLLGVAENIDEIYDTDFPINSLVGEKVKHHRFPSIQYMAGLYNVTSYGVDAIDSLGIRLNIPQIVVDNLSALGIVSLRLVYAKRDLSNATVLGTSVLEPSGQITDFPSPILISNGGNWRIIDDDNSLNNTDLANDKYARFNCFDLLQDKPNLLGSYLRFNLKLKVIIDNGFDFHILANFPSEDLYAALSKFCNGEQLNNGGTSISSSATSSQYVTSKFANLTNANYILDNGILNLPGGEVIDNRLSEETTFLVSDGDVTLHEPAYSNGYKINNGGSFGSGIFEELPLVSLKKIINNVFNDYKNQELVYSDLIPLVADNSKVIYSGDGFMCNYSYVAATRIHKNYDPVADEEDLKAIRNVKCFYTIGRHNPCVRHNLAGDVGTYYYPLNSIPSVTAINAPFLWLFEQNFFFKPLNKFLYDKDYSLPNYLEQFNIYSGTTLSFSNKFPNRIHRSLATSLESKFEDGWRIFLPLEYIDITRNKGDITNLVNWGDYMLLIHTEQSLLRTNSEATLKVDNISVNLGSGDLFEIRPKEVNATSYGYGGTKHKFACLMCEAGYFFPDLERREWFLYNGESLLNISKGLKSDFEQYMIISKVDESTNTNIPSLLSDNPFNNYGVTCAFDKENYRIVAAVKAGGAFTMSFDLIKQEWTSYHDYYPDYLYNTRKRLYSLKDKKNYAHNFGLRGNFYGTIYPFFVDLVVNQEPTKEKVLAAVSWVSHYIDGNGAVQINKTIDNISIRTAKYNTGKVPIVVNATNSILENEDANTKMIDGSWFFDDIYNRLRPDRELLSEKTNTIYTDYILDQQYFEEPHWTEAEPLRDKYFIIRLEFSNFEDSEIRLTSMLPSLRLSKS